MVRAASNSAFGVTAIGTGSNEHRDEHRARVGHQIGLICESIRERLIAANIRKGYRPASS